MPPRNRPPAPRADGDRMDLKPLFNDLVRLETDPLSRAEIVEATRLSLSYSIEDLVTLDWAAGFIADRERTRHWHEEPVFRRPRRPPIVRTPSRERAH